MTPAQQRFMEILSSQSAGGRWVQWWDVVEAWGRAIPLYFVGNAGSKCSTALQKRGLIEECPADPTLIRPVKEARDVSR